LVLSRNVRSGILLLICNAGVDLHAIICYMYMHLHVSPTRRGTEQPSKKGLSTDGEAGRGTWVIVGVIPVVEGP
jgi:hypothetical protein